MRLNQVVLAGRVYSVSEPRTYGDKSVCEIRMSQSKRKNAHKQQEPPEWHQDWVTAVAWGKSADVAQTLQKGDRVIVEGRLKYEEWDSKEKGRQSHLKIEANYLHKLIGSDEPSGSSGESFPTGSGFKEETPF